MKLALFLIAGRGSRIRTYSDNIPKCLIDIGGQPILHSMLDKLERSGVKKSILVIGYLGDKIIKSVGQSWGSMEIVYVENKIWETTNNIYSLFLASKLIDEDFYLLEGDIIISDEAFNLLKGKPDFMAVSKWQEHLDGTMVELEADKVGKFFLKKDLGKAGNIKALFKTVNIYGLDANNYKTLIQPEMESLVKSGETGLYYEKAFATLANSGKLKFRAVDFSFCKWAEVDNESDLEYARNLFND
jgi:NDP-sugar pyrophosphorylase family protein